MSKKELSDVEIDETTNALLSGGRGAESRPRLTTVEGGRTRNATAEPAEALDIPEEIPTKKVGFSIRVDVLEEFESIVARFMGYPHCLNNSRAVEEAIKDWIVKMRAEHNNGQPYEPLPPEAKLRRKGGRPRGS